MGEADEIRGTAAGAEADPRLGSVDLLIDTWRHHADTWAARMQAAEARAAAVATAAAALGTLVVSQAEALSKAETRATIAFALLMAAVAVSLLARVLPRARVGRVLGGLLSRSAATDAAAVEAAARAPNRWDRVRLLARTPSQEAADEALERLRLEGESIAATPIDAEHRIVVRLAVHDYWCARAESNHRSYNAKARWVTLAAVLLTAALISLALAGLTIIDEPSLVTQAP